jgi:membrane protein YdbS with pleckstrin-like domain
MSKQPEPGLLSWLRGSVLRLLKVPATPTPPQDGGGTVRVFRASHNFYRYNLVKWVLAQVGALGGLVFGLFMLRMAPTWTQDTTVLFVFEVIEVLAWLAFLVQLPFTYAMLRLDYQLRWYIVSERSLRIREGLAHVREKTMTFANIQNMTVRQGPLQRLLGIADLQVQTAGGGGAPVKKGAMQEGAGGESMHVGYFRGVDNVAEIRDLIRDRVRLHRDAGLGDPDDLEPTAAEVTEHQTTTSTLLLDAAQELLAEIRVLRRAVVAGGVR